MEAYDPGTGICASLGMIRARRPAGARDEDRCHRIGQGKRVDVIIPTVAGTIDADIQELLDRKQSMIEEVLAARFSAENAQRDNQRPGKPALSLSKSPAPG